MKTITASVVSIGVLLLYVPLCCLLYILLGLRIMPFIMVLAVIPVTLVAVFFTGWKTAQLNE